MYAAKWTQIVALSFLNKWGKKVFYDLLRSISGQIMKTLLPENYHVQKYLDYYYNYTHRQSL